MATTLRKGPPAWLAFLAAGLVAVVAFRLVPSGGAQSLLYLLLVLAGAAAVGAGVWRHRPKAYVAWLLLGAGQLSLFCGSLPVYLAPLFGFEKPGFPSLLTVIYVAQYPLTGVGLLLLIKRRAPSWDVASLIDAAILTVSASLLSWVYLISPLTADPTLTMLDEVAIAAFPLGDVLLLAVGARLMLGAGLRPPSLWLLAGYLVLIAVGDTGQGVESLNGTLVLGGHWPETMWVIAAVTLGTAGLHPSVRAVEELSPTADPEAGSRRLALLAVASLLAPTTLLIQYFRGAPLHVPLVCATCALLFLLVLGRMARLVATQREVAITDGLTGLHTRRYFEHSLAVEGERALRGAGLAVLLLDIDHFKAINDTYGHHGGDRVLCEVSRRLKVAMRGGDLVARYGGEEFAILIPNTLPPIAREIAERVRLSISEVPMAVSPTTSVSVAVSIGVATMPEDATSVDDLVLLADQLLYASKETGRNRVTSTANRTAVPEPANADRAEDADRTVVHR
ncbi:diguanylate cyclase [Cryptosporangium sp. NPDC048952]|uniref:GGDEF domain-containing protein n=1 Tax=Cryptosporangium sp. NPDC048952 TaxID=3363961 RepID=UPI003717CC80